MLRQDAIGAFGEALVGDIETSIEARPEVLPRDHGRQLDQLFFAEFFEQGTDHVIGRPRRCFGECGCVVEHAFFKRAELIGGSVVSQREKLCLADSLISADGGVDIQSKQTADHRRCLKAGERL